jgi:hypothetical protein
MVKEGLLKDLNLGKLRPAYYQGFHPGLGMKKGGWRKGKGSPPP